MMLTNNFTIYIGYHKTLLKARFIVAAAHCSVKPFSETVTFALKKYRSKLKPILLKYRKKLFSFNFRLLILAY